MSYKLVTDSPLQDGDLGTQSWYNGTKPDALYGMQVRIVTLWVLFAVGSLGNLLVFVWLSVFHRRRSRLHKIVFGISIADMCVCIFNVLVSAIYELQGASWYAGNIGCKLVMFMQSVSLMASSNMVALLAVDRHQAVRSPLKKGYSLRVCIALLWACPLLFSTPQLFIWYQKDRGTSKTCSTSFPEPVSSWKVAYITYAAALSFLFPFVVMSAAYIRITTRIWARASDTSLSASIKTTTVYCNGNRLNLRVTSSALFNKAKNKTLTMSTVIIIAFMACGLPYFIVEIIRCYSTVFTINNTAYAVLGTFAVSNSAVNPYIFLLFNLGNRAGLTRERASTT